MNTDKNIQAQEAHDATETSELSLGTSKLPYHAPQLTVHGKLERVTQQGQSGGGPFGGDTGGT